MALKKGISYQWRVFLPILLSFWVVIISMACWQLYRVREIKKEMVFDQLSMVGNRLIRIYDNNEPTDPELFIESISDYFNETNKYDDISIYIRSKNDSIYINKSSIEPEEFNLLPETQNTGMLQFRDKDMLEGSHRTAFLYFRGFTNDSTKVAVFLPYTNEVARTLSYSTARFWLVFFGIALFVSIFAYISSLFLARNLHILRDFARGAANRDANFNAPELLKKLPHDELGDISRQIVDIYTQRQKEYEAREREHRIALNAVEEKERIKRELTSNINHELKTPVGVIQGYIDTIIDNPDMDIETRDRFLFKTQESVHRLTSLINDITLITKLDSGGKLINVGEVDFHDMVFTLANFVEEGNVLKGKMEFEFDIPLNCKVLANESLLNASILNLVKNAVAYSQGTLCRLEYIKEDNDGMLHFSFYDNGIGVAPEHLSHLFERFYRVNQGRSRDSGGTGLGLPIVEVTITAFGGTISAVNHYPRGLQFDFTLPKYTNQRRETSQSQ